MHRFGTILFYLLNNKNLLFHEGNWNRCVADIRLINAGLINCMFSVFAKSITPFMACKVCTDICF